MNPCMLRMIDTKYKFIDLETCENQYHLFLSAIFWILLLFLLYINYFINHFRSAMLSLLIREALIPRNIIQNSI